MLKLDSTQHTTAPKTHTCHRTQTHAGPNRGATGGHVKLARSPLTALWAFDWYVVPACSAHNKRSSCGTYRVKPGTLAVRFRPSLGDRIASYPADAKKLVAAFFGKHH